MISRNPLLPVFAAATCACSAAAALLSASAQAALEAPVKDDFSKPLEANWDTREGTWKLKDGVAQASGKFGRLVWRKFKEQDAAVTARVAYVHDAPQAASGIQVRLAADGTGYAACLREIERGENPQTGPWERPLVQLFRIDKDGWKLLQEAKVMNARAGELRTLKLVCQGPNLYVFYEDMATPVLREFDDRYLRAGEVALWKDTPGSGLFDDFTLAAPDEGLTPPSTTDWSWVKGAVYVRSDAVNAVEMWQDYWDHTATVDRELSYAAAYGFNMVQVDLHWIVWDRHGEEYLKRIDDFLTRADRHGLKVNLIFWDDCGNVEPALEFAAPVPGRHNSQMMPNPSHAIRDDKLELGVHRDRFKAYVEGVAGRFKDDPRISFWQLYNEAMGPKELYRTGEGDSSINTLLQWTREWIKGTGTRIPVTATGGGFYGAKQSDFPSYHSYRSGEGGPLPNADGGPEHLCTETLNRPAADLAAVIRDIGGKQNGFVVWELMIGRDNCRFPWDHPDGPDEPAAPFHGVVYPDGHPWDLAEVKTLAGEEAFHQRGWFDVAYFQGDFQSEKKKSVTPRIDFDLGDEAGTGSPDASTGIGKDHFSIRWTGEIVAPATGTFTFHSEGDGAFTLRMSLTEVIARTPDQAEASGQVRLREGDRYPLVIEYVHGEGVARQKLSWKGPDGVERVFEPSPRRP